MYCVQCKALDAEIAYYEGILLRYVCDTVCLEEYKRTQKGVQYEGWSKPPHDAIRAREKGGGSVG